MSIKGSSLPKFYAKTTNERLETVADITSLSDTDKAALRAGLDMKTADYLIENAIGTFALPLGVATNFRINGRDYLVPMVIEEPSVIAAASAGAKATQDIKAAGSGSHLIGQIQVLNPHARAVQNVRLHEAEIVDAIKEFLSRHMSVVEVSSGMLDADSEMMKVEIVIDTGEAMGANAVNTVCEGIAPLIERITGGRVLLRILSNYIPNTVRAEACFDVDESVAAGIVNAYRFAAADRYRATTHNKGIMNGVIAVGLATGQDTRAIESAAHAYAADSGRYSPLSEWKVRSGRLWGNLALPLRVGTVGGLTIHHPTATACLKILKNPTSQELAEIMTAIGLCQNFSALKALATDGIQKGHMKLHKRRL